MDTLDRLSLDPVPPQRRPRRRSGLRTALLALLVLGVLAGAAVVNSRRQHHTPTAAPPPAPAAVTSGLACGSAPGAAVVRDADVSFHTPRGRQLRLIAWRCTDALGSRYPSLVQVLDASPGGPDRAASARATLIGVERDFHLASVLLDVDGDSVFATGILGAAKPATGGSSGTGTSSDTGAAAAGAMVRLSFHTADDQTWNARSAVTLAARCEVAELTVTAQPARADPSSAVLSFTNDSAHSCAVEGYPSVQSWAADLTGPAAHESFTAGPGPAHDAPAVLLVPAHGQFRAVLDSGDRTPAGGPTLCTRTDRLTVGLPSQTATRSLRIGLRLCDLRIHPLTSADWPAAGG